MRSRRTIGVLGSLLWVPMQVPSCPPVRLPGWPALRPPISAAAVTGRVPPCRRHSEGSPNTCLLPSLLQRTPTGPHPARAAPPALGARVARAAPAVPAASAANAAAAAAAAPLPSTPAALTRPAPPAAACSPPVPLPRAFRLAEPTWTEVLSLAIVPTLPARVSAAHRTPTLPAPRHHAAIARRAVSVPQVRQGIARRASTAPSGPATPDATSADAAAAATPLPTTAHRWSSRPTRHTPTIDPARSP